MAERRMFAKSIVLSDAFLDLPMSARCLYFTLGMLADDDGFVNNPRSIMRSCGASDTDMKLLIAARFVLAFESGVIVIKHWRINNYLRSDRYTATKCLEEKALVTEDENGAYQSDSGIPPGIPPGIPSIGKDRLGKDRLGNIFVPPTVEEVAKYCQERNNTIDPELFVDWYSARNWYLSKGIKMKDWKAAVRTWERRRDGDKRIPSDRTTGTKAVFDLPEVF